MELSKKERLILLNQYLILEKLDPDEADSYRKYAKILKEGYAYHYQDLVEWFYDDMSEEDTQEVLDILEMYRRLVFSYRDLGSEEKAKVDGRKLEFRGFDGNNETIQLAYVRFFLEDEGRYDELHNEHHDYNSHMPMLGKYRRMLDAYKSIVEDNDYRMLTSDEINEIVNA